MRQGYSALRLQGRDALASHPHPIRNSTVSICTFNICLQFSVTSAYESYTEIQMEIMRVERFLMLNLTRHYFDHITQLIPKLSKSCYVLRCIRPFVSRDALKSLHYSYCHSLITYGIIFGGNSSYSSHIFRLQNKAVRIITGSRPRDSCRELFKHLRILPLQSQYILSLFLFIVNNKNFSM